MGPSPPPVSTRKESHPSWLGRILYDVTARIVTSALSGRLTSVTGLEHLPKSGPCLLVANHRSAIDHFILAYILRATHRELLFGPTTSLHYRGLVARAWLDATGAIPVDHANVASTYARIEQLLSEARFVVMYPEDRRGDGTHLVPFKLGAFNIALRTRLPIHPVVLLGTSELLPKGRLYLQKGRTAAVIFAPPIPASAIAELGVQGAAERCRLVLELLLRENGQSARVKKATACTTAYLIARAVRLLDELEADPPRSLSQLAIADRTSAAHDLLRLALINDPKNAAAIAAAHRARELAKNAIG